MIVRNHTPVSHRYPLLGLACSSVYTRHEVSPEDRALGRRIDELHVDADARLLHDLAIERPKPWARGHHRPANAPGLP